MRYEDMRPLLQWKVGTLRGWTPQILSYALSEETPWETVPKPLHALMTGFRHRRQDGREAVCRRFLKDSRTGFDRWVEGKLKDPSFREAHEEAKKEITPMKIETLQLGLVDIQPLYMGLAELQKDFLPKETRQFLLFQLRTTIKELRRNAKYVEERLTEMEPLLPTAEEPKKVRKASRRPSKAT